MRNYWDCSFINWNNCVFSVSRLAGELADGATYRGIPFRVRRSKLRVEIAVEGSLAAATVEEVVRVVNVGDPGDDKVFVVPMDECQMSGSEKPEAPQANEKHLLLSRHAASQWSEETLLTRQH